MIKAILVILVTLAIVTSANSIYRIKEQIGYYYVGIVVGNCMALDELIFYRDKAPGAHERDYVIAVIDSFADLSGHSVESYKQLCKKAKAIGDRLEAEEA